MSKTFIITIDDDKAADHFIQWLCNRGEQHYWFDNESYQVRHPKEPQTVVVNFTYDWQNSKINGTGGNFTLNEEYL